MRFSPASPFSFSRRVTSLLSVICMLPVLVGFQSAEPPIVQTILFYSPTCPYCHTVINELLIPMQEQYGEQLQIIGVDTSHPAGNELFQNAIEWHETPEERQAVPFLVIGDVVLVGGGEVMSDFTRLVEDGLQVGGIGWPDIPDLSLIIPDLPPSAAPNSEPGIVLSVTAAPGNVPQESDPVAMMTALPSREDLPQTAIQALAESTRLIPTSPPSVQNLERMNRDTISSGSEEPPPDPVGFGLAMAVLFAMVLALIYTMRLILRMYFIPSQDSSSVNPLSWAVPALAMLGLVVALYLSYVEVTQVKAICGPVGECNIVQSSPYAQLIGFPVAILGALTYLAIVVLWVGQRLLPDRFRAISLLSLLALTIFCTGFSIYLTLLELFVIRAICAWCLSSAVITALLMILVVKSINRGSLQMKLAASV